VTRLCHCVVVALRCVPRAGVEGRAALLSCQARPRVAYAQDRPRADALGLAGNVFVLRAPCRRSCTSCQPALRAAVRARRNQPFRCPALSSECRRRVANVVAARLRMQGWCRARARAAVARGAREGKRTRQLQTSRGAAHARTTRPRPGKTGRTQWSAHNTTKRSPKSLNIPRASSLSAPTLAAFRTDSVGTSRISTCAYSNRLLETALPTKHLYLPDLSPSLARGRETDRTIRDCLGV
jgi:hypothetical protein